MINQLELTAIVKVTIFGFLRFREEFQRLIKWVESFVNKLISDYNWYKFRTQNGITSYRLINIEHKCAKLERKQNSE